MNNTRSLGGQAYGTVPPIEQRSRPAARPAPVAAHADHLGYDEPAAPTMPTNPAPSAEDGVVHLSRGYRAHDLDDLRVIKLRRPVGRDIKRCGNPARYETDAQGRITNIEVKWDVVAAYIPLLASPPVPSATVDEFEFEDLDACAAVIVPFFVRTR